MAAALWFMLTVTYRFQFLTAILPVGMKRHLTVDLDRSSLNLSGLIPLPDSHPHTQSVLLQLDFAGETPPAPSVLISPVQTLVSRPACPLLLKCLLQEPSQALFPQQCYKPTMSPADGSP